MIEQFFRPDSVEQALELKRRFQDRAVYFAGGSKLNATPTRTEKTVAISLKGLGLDRVTWHGGALHLGALTTLQQLRDTARLPRRCRMHWALSIHAICATSLRWAASWRPARPNRY